MRNYKKKNNPSLVFLTILFLIALSIPLLVQGAVHRSSQSQEVILNDAGFYPEKINISKGTKVIWKIDGNKEHWPASNFHPTHGEYPEKEGCIGSKLDACRGLKNGESYDFTFDKAGNWGLHDHLFPGFTMVVIVTDEKHQSENIYSKISSFLNRKKDNNQIASNSAAKQAEISKSFCRNEENYKNLRKGKNIFACYAEEFDKIAYQYGQEYAHLALAALQIADPEAKNCHFIAHGIGWGVYRKNPSDWQNLIAQSSPRCSYGEQMGIIEQYTQTLPDGQLKKKDVPNLCGQNPKADCNHAVGHMMLVNSKNDLDKAIDLCSALTDQKQQFICFQGMIMERFVGGNLREHGIIPESTANWPSKLPEDRALCDRLTGLLELACWREIVHPAYFYYNKEPKPILDFCEQAPSSEAIRLCKIHMIPEIAGGQNYDPQYLKKMCDGEEGRDPQFAKACLLEFVPIKMNFVFLQNAKDVVPYCNSLSQELQPRCFMQIGSSLRQMRISPDQVTSFCSGAPKEHKDLCEGKSTFLPAQTYESEE